MQTSASALGSRPHPLRSPIAALLVTAVDAGLLALALGGLEPLLAHSRAVALLVAWGLGGLVLGALKPVRSHDPVEIGRESPAMLAALFLIPLVTPPLSAFGARMGWWLLPGGLPVQWAGVALSAAGLGLRIVAMAQLGSRFSPLIAVQREHALETRGVYAHVRHPGYLGSWLTALGGALAFGSGFALPLLVVMLLLFVRRMRQEEAVLEGHFGEDYRRYRRGTGGFLPRFGGSRASD